MSVSASIFSPVSFLFCLQFLDLNPGLFIPFGQLARIFRDCVCPPNSATFEICSAFFRVLATSHSLPVQFAPALAATFLSDIFEILNLAQLFRDFFFFSHL